MDATQSPESISPEELLPFEKPPIQEEKQEEKKPAAKSTALSTTDTGTIALQSLSDQLKFGEILLAKKMVSSTFSTPGDVVIGIQYCKELKLPVIAGLRLMYVVNNRPCLYSEGPLLLCQRTGEVESFEEFFVDSNGDRICVEKKNLTATVYAAVTRVKRRGQEGIQEDYFTKDDLAKAKLDVGKGGKKDVWEKWERLMMRYKARSMALKSKFADCIGGIGIAEYDHSFSPEMPEIAPAANNVAQELNETYGGDQ